MKYSILSVIFMLITKYKKASIFQIDFVDRICDAEIGKGVVCLF